MKPLLSVALATWLLKHLPGSDPSLTGDLLEELHAGRSAAWYWHQTLSSIAVTLSRSYLLPVVFSAGWSLLYPSLWPSLMANPFTQSLLTRVASHDWPYSTSLQVVGALFPSLVSVWMGIFVYLVLRRRFATGIAPLRLLVSLSLSLNVLLVGTIAEHLGHAGVDLRDVSPENFSVHFVALSIPSALSLFVALVCVLPTPRPSRHSNLLAR